MAGVKACCVALFLCPRSGLAGSREARQYAIIKRQRPHLDEQFTHKCCQTGALIHDVMCISCACAKRDIVPVHDHPDGYYKINRYML